MYFGQLYSNEVGACNHKSMSSSSSAEKKGERPSYTCMFVLADNNNKGTRPAEFNELVVQKSSERKSPWMPVWWWVGCAGGGLINVHKRWRRETCSGTG